MFKDKNDVRHFLLCKRLWHHGSLGTTLNNVVYFIIYVIVYQI